MFIIAVFSQVSKDQEYSEYSEYMDHSEYSETSGNMRSVWHLVSHACHVRTLWGQLYGFIISQIM